MKFTKKQLEDLIETLKSLPDPRCKRGTRHRMISIIAISICAVLCGCRSYAAIAQWAKNRTQNQLKRLYCRRNYKTRCCEPPSEPTIRRTLQKTDAEVVDQSVYKWLESLYSGDAVAFDGKVLKGARTKDGLQVNLLSAIIHQKGITIAQEQVSSKSNEIPSVIPLLEELDLEGKVVTGDALHTQTKTADFIVEKKTPITFSP